MCYNYSDPETSALLRQFIYKKARRISRQITQAATEVGYLAAERRQHPKEEPTAVRDAVRKPS
jgi:hypothetical protein